MTQGVYMTQKELHRVEILSKVSEKIIKQPKAAKILNISVRQLQRLLKEYKKHGAQAIASKKRGKRSNNKLSDSIRSDIKEIVCRPIYSGFRPTLMCEKLEERHYIKVSKETTRQIMIECGLWRSRKERRPVIHQQRQRRPRLGELVQIDGSPHAWLEDRAEPCCLLVFIDDATGRTYGKFVEAETTAGYMQTMHEYLQKYGAPLAVYSDKHGIFRVNQGQSTKPENFTQLGRALNELDIDLIYAHSPQAKGRVERANETLQDRLIKEMRLAGVNTLSEANNFLEGFWPKYNKKFNVKAACEVDAHRELPSYMNLETILCRKEQRKVSKNMEFQFNNIIYQISPEANPKLKGVKITINELLNGTITFEYNGKPFQATRYGEQKSGIEISDKEIDRYFRQKSTHKPSYRHPWSQARRAETRMRQYQGQ